MNLVLLLEILFSYSFVIFKKSLLFGTPFFLVGLRMIFGGIANLFLQAFKNKNEFKIPMSLWKTILVVSIFNIFITNAFELWGMQYVTAAKTSFIYNCSPFVSALFGYIFLHEKMNINKWVGLIIGFVGFLPILMSSLPTEQKLSYVGFLSSAELAIIAAALATAFGWIFLKKLVYKQHYPMLMANGTTMIVGGTISLLTSFLIEDQTYNNIFSPYVIWYTVWAGLISNVICYNLYAFLLKKYSATFMSFAGFSMPLFTALFGWVFLRETVGWPFFVSVIVVFTGLSIYYQEEVKSFV